MIARKMDGPLGLTTRQIARRLFVTCWLVYALHFATNTVREIYPALAIGDHFSFRVDEYANMHPDLFEKPGYGWHIGNNPGASMVAAIPYALARPLIDPIVRRVQQQRPRCRSSLARSPARRRTGDGLSRCYLRCDRRPRRAGVCRLPRLPAGSHSRSARFHRWRHSDHRSGATSPRRRRALSLIEV